MKLKFFKIALVLTMAAFAKPVSAQNLGPEWGPDDSTRLANATLYSFFQESYKLKDYDEALVNYRQLVATIPNVRSMLYSATINIYRDKISSSTDESQTRAYVDTLMSVYDTYIEHFSDDPKVGRAFLKEAKAVEYVNLMGNDRETARKLLKEAVDADENGTNTNLINIYFEHLTNDYQLFETLDMDTYLSEYDALSAKFDESQSETKNEDREVFDMLAVRSGALGCENMETIYGPRLVANPTDTALFRKTLSLLGRNKCDGPFFMSVAERLNELSPSGYTALLMASVFENKKEYAKAISCLTTAASQETDPGFKESLYIRLAVNNLGAKNARAAADNARQAIAINPNSGLGYYMYAQALGSGASGCESGFPQQSVYWLVYDNLSKARSFLANDKNQIVDIDKQMSDYRNSFPKAEDIFFMNLKDGDAYNVKCGWITGTTTVRSVK